MRIIIQILEIISFPALGTGLYYALYDDRNGDKHPNHDWVAIGIVIAVSSICISLISQIELIFNHQMFSWLRFGIDNLRNAAMGLAICIIFFPWVVCYMLVTRKVIELPRGNKWYNHFSKTAIPDKWPWWCRLHWSVRFTIGVVVALPFIFIYFI